MTIVALACIALAVLQMFLRRWQEQDFKAEREEWTRERATLLNRIKPETAQPVPGEPEYPSPRGVVPDDDDAFWRAHGIDTSEVR